MDRAQPRQGISSATFVREKGKGLNRNDPEKIQELVKIMAVEICLEINKEKRRTTHAHTHTRARTHADAHMHIQHKLTTNCKSHR